MTPTAQERLAAIVARHAHRRGSLLPILHDVQCEFGCIPSVSIRIIATALNLSRAEVHGTITFYHDFRFQPPSKPVVKLCRAEACQARGVERIASILEQDDRVQVEPVYCLGLCATGPNAMVGNRLFSRLDEEKSRALVEQAARA